MKKILHLFFTFSHATLRRRLFATYLGGVALAVILVFASYHLFYLPADIRFFEGTGYLWFVARVLVAAVLVASAFGWLMSRSFQRQIDSLTTGARRIAAGDLQTRLPITGQDELAQLAGTFNQMSAQLQTALEHEQKLERARRELVANVAHDLRTPLAALQATVEALEDGVAQDAAKTAEYLGAVGRETRYLSHLVDDLFALAQLDAEQFQLTPHTVYVEELAQETLAGLLPQLERAGVVLKVDLPADLPPVRADPHALRRVLTNLLQNALNFTPPGGCLTLRGTVSDNLVQLEVGDTGAGIAPEDVPHIFERFWRGDKSRARTGGGSGLGLAIARQLVERHGGHIWARSTVGQGTIIGFSLPTASNGQT